MIQFLENITANLGDNPYFGAGFGLVGLGAGLTGARRAFNYALILFKRNYVMTFEITLRDPSYPWMLNWLTQRQQSRRFLQLSLVTQFHQHASGKFNAKFNFVPSVGAHYVRFDNKWMKIERERQQTSVDLTMGMPFESIKFTCLGTDPEIFSRMLENAKDLEKSKHDGKMVIYQPRTTNWEAFGDPRDTRALDTVILDEGVAEKICKDLQEFLGSRDEYKKRGIPYRRGYLLHGPPGCGKTSFVNALAGAFGYDICTLNLGNSALADDRVNYLMNVLPHKSILLLEDIDAAFWNREDIDTNKPAYLGLGQLTLSGILNAIDGTESCEDRIIFMTTNYPERLDPALRRFGRISFEAYIGYATDNQLARAFDRFYFDKTNEPTGRQFVDSVKAAKSKISEKVDLSMASVQEHFLEYLDSPQAAVDNVDQLIEAVLAKKQKKLR